MTKLTRTLLLSILAFCLGTAAFAQPPSVSLTLTAPNPQQYAMGGVYTSPYQFSINGVTTYLMTCDDFLSNVYPGESWQAYQNQLSDINGTTFDKYVNFDTASPATPQQQQTDYETATLLTSWLMNWGLSDPTNTTGFGNAKAGELSYAIWAVFDPQLLNNTYQASLAPNAEGKLTATELSQAQFYLSQAQMDVASGSVGIPTANIYTYNGNPVSLANNPPQEFIQITGTTHSMPMPEPSSALSLVLDLAGVLGVVVLIRRRAVVS